MAMTFLARFRIKAEKEAYFIELCHKAEAVAAKEPDTLAYKFYKLDEPHVFAVFESFTGPEADEAHQKNPEAAPIIAEMIGCMDGTYTREYLHDI